MATGQAVNFREGEWALETGRRDSICDRVCPGCFPLVFSKKRTLQLITGRDL